MRYKGLILVCMLFTVLSSPVWAQDSTRFGIGVNLADLFQKSDYDGILEAEGFDYPEYPVFYVNVLIPHLRIEPEFGYWRFKDVTDRSGDYITNYERTLTMLHFGLGIAVTAPVGDKGSYYIGGRVGLDHITWDKNQIYSYDHSFKTKVKMWYAGPCLGMEYQVSKKLGLGSEIQVLYQKYSGNESNIFLYENDTEAYNTDLSGFRLRTKALVFLRWYF